MPLIQVCGSCGATIGWSNGHPGQGGFWAAALQSPKSSCPVCGVEFGPGFKLEITPVDEHSLWDGQSFQKM